MRLGALAARFGDQLAQEPRRLARPRQPELAAGARQADVEQPPLLGELLVGPGLLRRQLLLGEPRQEDRVELEPFRAVERQQVDAARAVAAGIEALPQVGREPVDVAVERLGERDEPRQVGLADELALAQLVGYDHQPARLERGRPHRLAGRSATAPLDPPQQAPRGVAHEQRCALERQPCAVENLLEVGQPGVRAAEDRHLLERHAAGGELPDPVGERRALGLGARERDHRRLRPGGLRRPQHLLGTAERRTRAGSPGRAPAASSGSSPRAGRRAPAGSAAECRAGATGSRR